MPYLIDGHNLIPKLGLRLDSPDDELELVAALQEFCRIERRSVEIFFDGAPAGRARTEKRGAVTAHFVRQGSSGDAAIAARLKKLARAARNWTVVSSDREVQANARQAGAQVSSAEEFASQVRQARAATPRVADDDPLTPEQIREWLHFFEGEDHKPG
jgi:predicted RNA-binding protein with PIN domain